MLPLLLITSALARPGGYRIEVDLSGDVAAGPLMLGYHEGPKSYVVEEKAITGPGKVVFTGEDPLPPGHYFVVLPPDRKLVDLVLSEDQDFTLQLKGPEWFDAAKVSGSEENATFLELTRFQAGQVDAMKAIQAKYAGQEGASERMQAESKAVRDRVWAKQDAVIAAHPDWLLSDLLAASREPEIPATVTDETARWEYYRAHFLDGLDFSQPGLVRSPILEQKLSMYLDKLTTRTHEAHVAAVSDLLERARADAEVFKHVAVMLLNRYAASKQVCFDTVYVHLVDTVYRRGQATWADPETTAKILARADQLAPVLCGVKAPDLALPDAAGKARALSEVKAERTVVLFWSPDCGSCKREVPEIGKVLADHPEVGLYAVSLDAAEGWDATLTEWGVQGGVRVARPDGDADALAAWDVRATPQVFVLDADHVIVAKKLGATGLRTVLERSAAP